jgi:hypothetical protein
VHSGLKLAVAAYVAITLIQVWPLLLDPFHQLANDPGDPMLNTWILWWNAHAWPLTARWWNAPAFYPATGVLAFSEHLLGLTPLTTPLLWITGSPEFAHNVAFMVSFPLAAIAAHLLVRQLTGRDDVAFVAGVAFGFAPYRVAHFAHIQSLWSFWLPLVLLGLHAGVKGRRWGFPLAAACWVMQGLSNGYLLIFSAILIAIWLAWFALARPRLFGAALGWFAVGGALLSPLLLGYERIHRAYGFARSVGEMEFYSADLMAVFSASYRLRLWGEMWQPGPEGELFPGFAMLALGAAGLVYLIATLGALGIARPNAVGGWLRWVRLPLLAVAMLFGTLALASLLAGGFWINLGFTRIPVVNPHKPFTVFVVSGALYLLLGIRAAKRPRLDATTAFYVVAAVIMLVLSWGPSPRLMHKRFLYKAPYAWLLWLPGLSSLRVPGRFGLLFGLCLAVGASLLLARWLKPGRRTTFVVAAIGLFAVAEGWFGPLPVVTSPLAARPAWISALGHAKAVLELPAGAVDHDVAAQARVVLHGRPVVNGYSGNFPPFYRQLERALRNGDVSALDALRPFGPIAIFVDRAADKGASIEAALDALRSVERQQAWPEGVLYRLPPAAADPHVVLGLPLGIAGVRASAPENVSLMLDGDVTTRWTSGAPQRGGEWVIADLGSSQAIGAIELQMGMSPADYPRGLAIDTSEDEVRWTAAFRGPVAAQAVRGAIDDPRTLPIIVATDGRGRYVRLTQFGRDEELWWSLPELRVHGPATAGR